MLRIKRAPSVVMHVLSMLSVLVGVVNASDGSFADQFVGNPLLILVAILVIDGLALVYRRLRK